MKENLIKNNDNYYNIGILISIMVFWLCSFWFYYEKKHEFQDDNNSGFMSLNLIFQSSEQDVSIAVFDKIGCFYDDDSAVMFCIVKCDKSSADHKCRLNFSCHDYDIHFVIISDNTELNMAQYKNLEYRAKSAASKTI